MIYLIYTAIILELVFAIAIVVAILRINANINNLNEQIIEYRPKIRENLRKIRLNIGKINSVIDGFGENFRKKRNNFILNMLKKILITSSLRLFLKKYKKQLIYAELIIIAYETIQNSIKA